MLDAAKYAQHFPDENQRSATPPASPSSAPRAVSSSLLAALCKLEKEFREILRAQQSEHPDRSE